MSRFYDKSELTPEQKARYDQAVIDYWVIQKSNIDHMISNLTEDDRAGFREQGQMNDEQIRMFYTMARSINTDEEKSKSALFYRLLDGKRPLVIAPPLSFSYPWYDVIEGSGPWTITAPNSSKTIADMATSYFDYATSSIINGLLINQSCWSVIHSPSETQAIVTFGEWEKFGFTWHLKREAIPAVSSATVIASFHDKSIGRIVTTHELRLEQLWVAQSRFDSLKWALDKEAADEYIARRSKVNNFEGYAAKNEVEAGRKILAQRRKAGLEDTPSRREIESLAVQLYDDALGGDVFADAHGNLFFYEWRLHSLSKGDI